MSRTALVTAIAAIVFMIPSGLLASPVGALDNELCDVNADFALGREDYAAAIMLHRKFLQSHPRNELAHYHLGFAYGMTGQASEELGEYLTAAGLGLKQWDLFLNLGLAYFAQHQSARAVEALQTAAVLAPERAEPHFNLALVYESENRFTAALSEIEAARRLAPNDPDIANTNAIICVEMGNAGLAYDIWTVLIRFAPNYAPARINLAIVSGSHREDSTTRALSQNTYLWSHNGAKH